MFSKETYIERRNRLRQSVKSGIILLLGNSEQPANYRSNTFHFRQDSNFLYYFGLNVADFAGVIDIEAGTECIYGDDYTVDDIVWMGPQPSTQDLAESVGVKSGLPVRELYTTISNAIKLGRRIHILPPYREANMLKLQGLLGVSTDRIKDYVSTELIQAVVAMREIKSDEEIAEIDRACEIGWRMHTTAMKMCAPGVVEREIAGAIEGIALSYGSGVSFHSIVSQNGETLHNHNHNNILEDGRLLLVDAGAESTMNYCSDFTRTMPVNGKFSSRQRDIYNIVLAAHDRAIELARPDVTYQEIHRETARTIAEGLTSLGLMKGSVDDIVANGATAMFFPHGLGHQMGLDVHDMEDLGEKYVGYDKEVERSTQFGIASLRMGKRLKVGTVLTDEPGIYFIPALIDKWQNEKINNQFINFDKVREYIGFGGIRIEDDLLITPTGNRVMGPKRIPVTVEQIEAFMAK